MQTAAGCRRQWTADWRLRSQSPLQAHHPCRTQQPPPHPGGPPRMSGCSPRRPARNPAISSDQYTTVRPNHSLMHLPTLIPAFPPKTSHMPSVLAVNQVCNSSMLSPVCLPWFVLSRVERTGQLAPLGLFPCFHLTIPAQGGVLQLASVLYRSTQARSQELSRRWWTISTASSDWTHVVMSFLIFLPRLKDVTPQLPKKGQPTRLPRWSCSTYKGSFQEFYNRSFYENQGKSFYAAGPTPSETARSPTITCTPL